MSKQQLIATTITTVAAAATTTNSSSSSSSSSSSNSTSNNNNQQSTKTEIVRDCILPILQIIQADWITCPCHMAIEVSKTHNSKWVVSTQSVGIGR